MGRRGRLLLSALALAAVAALLCCGEKGDPVQAALDRMVKATLRIAGLGQYEARIGSSDEGRPVAPHGLHQAWTDYRKTITYDSYDVTKMLTPGQHVLGVMLGAAFGTTLKTWFLTTHRAALGPLLIIATSGSLIFS